MTILEMIKNGKTLYDKGGNDVYTAKALMGTAIKILDHGFSPDCDYDIFLKHYPNIDELPFVTRGTLIDSAPMVDDKLVVESEETPEPITMKKSHKKERAKNQ